jgi:hypothetical protein
MRFSQGGREMRSAAFPWRGRASECRAAFVDTAVAGGVSLAVIRPAFQISGYFLFDFENGDECTPVSPVRDTAK